MTNQQAAVRDWMKIARQDFPDKPTIPTREIQELREKLIEEELLELKEAFADNDLVAVADALADLDYVVKGTWVACGLDDEDFFNEVHRSNCTKFVRDCHGNLTVTKNIAGKVLKPATYEPPNLEPILMALQKT